MAALRLATGSAPAGGGLTPPSGSGAQIDPVLDPERAAVAVVVEDVVVRVSALPGVALVSRRALVCDVVDREGDGTVFGQLIVNVEVEQGVRVDVSRLNAVDRVRAALLGEVRRCAIARAVHGRRPLADAPDEVGRHHRVELGGVETLVQEVDWLVTRKLRVFVIERPVVVQADFEIPGASAAESPGHAGEDPGYALLGDVDRADRH